MSSSSKNGSNNQPISKEELELEKMLPWLVNGTLSGKEREQLESALTQSEKLSKEKEILHELHQQVKQQNMPDVPIEFAWQKMKRHIDKEKEGSNTKVNIIPDNKEKKWRYLAIAASVAFVIQSSSLLITWEHDTTYTPLSSDSVGTRSSEINTNLNSIKLTIQFVNNATVGDIQLLLREFQLNIISGPSAVGLYRLEGTIDSQEKIKQLVNQLKKREDVIAHIQLDE